MTGSSTLSTSVQATLSRDCVIENMERLLKVWFEGQNQAHVFVSKALIKVKALSLRKMCKEENYACVTEITVGSDEAAAFTSVATPAVSDTFSANDGWLARFKKRAHLHSIKIQEAASADIEAARDFPKELARIVEEGDCSRK